MWEEDDVTQTLPLPVIHDILFFFFKKNKTKQTKKTQS